MNWEALGAIAELVGAVAVIASLIYLAIQVRVNTESVRQSTRAQLAQTSFASDERAQKYVLALLQDESVAALLSRGNAGEQLTELEALRYGEWVSTLITTHLTFFLANRDSLLSGEQWHFWKHRYRRLLERPGFRKVWSEIRDGFDPVFRDYFDDLAESASQDQPTEQN